MIESQYLLELQELTDRLQLGEWSADPQPLAGGLLHRMFAFRTTRGRYAAKALNPQIMLRPEAMGNYIRSEQIARLAAEKLPAVPAKVWEGAFMHQAGGHYYMFFDWVEGKALEPGLIDTGHCREIGKAMAAIHSLDAASLGTLHAAPGSGPQPLADWQAYARQGQQEQASWAGQLAAMVDSLRGWQEQANEADQHLAAEQVVCHRDLDPKNVLWSGGQPIIIDWESAGLANPWMDLADTATSWAELPGNTLDEARFRAVLEGYSTGRAISAVDWNLVLASGYSGRLGWLEYNLKRALWIECSDQKEQQLGEEQVRLTLEAIRRYALAVPEMARWLAMF